MSSSHRSDIPQAVRIAASTDPSIAPALRQQAVEYLTKVRELCEETWQDCLQLYLQGAGAAGPSSVGKDGQAKLDLELRMFCEQVVDHMLINKPEAMSDAVRQSTYDSLLNFVKTEWVEGPGEAGQTFFRNKLSTTLAYLFVDSYPANGTFLHPFFTLMNHDNFHARLLAIHLLTDIALEIHDVTMRSARSWSKGRQERDGNLRDAIRTTGDEGLAMGGLLRVAEKGLDELQKGESAKWLEVTELCIRTYSMWTPWTDLNVALTSSSLSFLLRVLRQRIIPLRIAAANVVRTFVAKGIQDSKQRIEVLRGLDIVSMLTPLEAETRDQDDDELLQFRIALATIFQTYGSELVTFSENPEIPEDLRSTAASMLETTQPLLLRFMSDKEPEIIYTVAPFVGDLLRTFKKHHVAKVTPMPKGKMPPPAEPAEPLSPVRRDFLAQLQEILIRQLAWPKDSEWEAPTGEEPDPEEERASVHTKRITCRTFIESISHIDKSLHVEVVAQIVAATLQSIQRRESVPWQQAELALHLVYTFGEISKNNTRAAYYELPAELVSKSGRDRQRRISINKAHLDSEMSSGRTTPENLNVTEDALARPLPGIYYGGAEAIDYTKYPLTTLGQLLTLCMQSGVESFPHPSVTLQYLEIAVRYVEFWRTQPGAVKPMFQAMLGERGIHHPDKDVRRRCFYLFAKFLKDCKNELEPEMIAAVLDSMRDVMVINAVLPEADTPDEDVLLKATTGKSYFQDQLHLFEAAGNLVYLTKTDAARQLPLLEALAGPPITAVGAALSTPNDPQAVLVVHHNLLALGNFAKGFPQVSDNQVETLPYQGPFKQMTEALLQALDAMKTQRIVRDSARFAFSQFVNAIGTTVAELVPQFVSHVVTEFEPTELVDFMTFLGLLMHRLKTNTFETINMLLLPLLSRIFAILQSPITGTDEAQIHRRLKDAYLAFFIALMNANLDGVFITDRNQPEFENLLTAMVGQAEDLSDMLSQRNAWNFFARSVIAWATSGAPSVFAESALSGLSKAVMNGTAQPTNQHAMSKEARAAQALPGYENFVYQRLVPAAFQIPLQPKFNLNTYQSVIWEMSALVRNTVQARGQEAVDFLRCDILPKIGTPPGVIEEFIQKLLTQQSRDFRKTFLEFIKAVKAQAGIR